jgi:glycosyltransferase involved in cell wall biosynthesis
MTETSVLINTYNHAPFIRECVDSALSQTLRPGEVIAYDDGSSDGTVDILRAYGRRITLIEGKRLHQPPHIAQANAIQAAFAASTGNLIFLLDGDDRFKPAKLERYCAAFAKHPDSSVVQAPMEKIDTNGTPIGSNVEPRKHIIDHLQAIYRRHDVDFFYPTSALAFSRHYLEKVLPLDFSDELPLWTDTRLSVIAPYFGTVTMLPDSCTDWRRHHQSDSIRARSRGLQIRQTLMRATVFNNFCRRHGFKTISPWRNGRLYLQLVRYAVPVPIFSFFYDHVYPGNTSPRTR